MAGKEERKKSGKGRENEQNNIILVIRDNVVNLCFCGGVSIFTKRAAKRFSRFKLYQYHLSDTEVILPRERARRLLFIGHSPPFRTLSHGQNARITRFYHNPVLSRERQNQYRSFADFSQHARIYYTERTREYIASRNLSCQNTSLIISARMIKCPAYVCVLLQDSISYHLSDTVPN